jgi:hypothetical protein
MNIANAAITKKETTVSVDFHLVKPMTDNSDNNTVVRAMFLWNKPMIVKATTAKPKLKAILLTARFKSVLVNFTCSPVCEKASVYINRLSSQKVESIAQP